MLESWILELQEGAMRVKTVPILTLLSGLLGSIIATIAWPHPQEKADQLSEAEAMGMMRTINTLQAVAFYDPRHQYLSLDELASQHELWLTTLRLMDSSAGTLKDHRVSVVVSPDRQHYVSELISSSKNCALALFSNESGIIYTARGLGCEAEKSANKDPKAN
jgi:hypothetical protein